MELNRVAAYHGDGWRFRATSLEEDILSGFGWASYHCDAEWGRLRAVQLYIPGPAISAIRDPNAVLHLASIDHSQLADQLNRLVKVYESLGVQVRVLPTSIVDDRRHPNTVFQRDLFFQTRQGAVIARMASPVRAGEETYSSRSLAAMRVPIALTVGGRGTFEGADCLWANPNTVFCGIGKRTNEAGFEQVRHLLHQQGVSCIPLPIPSTVQHLLGCVQIISPGRALVRGDVVDAELLHGLRVGGLQPVLVEDSEEVLARQAFNFVVLSRDAVVMCAEAPQFRQTLQALQIDVVGVAPVSELAKAAGGLGCATGILHRESAM